jgi:hypothetical protein
MGPGRDIGDDVSMMAAGPVGVKRDGVFTGAER